MHAPTPAPRSVWLVRHAESASNAGLPTESTKSNPLSPLGREQAARLAQAFPFAPDLVVTSSYLRTVQTAEPLLNRFPKTPVSEWEIHEFTFLSGEKYRGTTEKDRLEAVQRYWALGDASYLDGDGAESFAAFMLRVEVMLAQIRQLEPGFTVIFSHGYVMKALLWRLLFRPESDPTLLIGPFTQLHRLLQVNNTTVFPLTVEHDGHISVGQPWEFPFDAAAPRV